MTVGLLTLTDQQQRDALSFYSGQFALPSEEPGFFTGALGAPVIGVKHGMDVAASALAETVSPFIEDNTPEGVSNWFRDQREIAYQSMKDTRADPRTMGTLAQIGHALGTVITEGAMVAPLGVFGAAANIGSLSAYDKYAELVDAGVDKDTARKAAGLTGVVMGVGAALPPFLGSTIARQIASGVGINVGLGFVERGGTAKILESGGYDEMASHYKMLDGTSVAIDAVLGAVFPLGARMMRRAPMGEPTTADIDLAMTGNEGIAERTRDPILQTTIEGLDARLAAEQEVSRQIIVEGRSIADLDIPREAVENTIPNPEVARVTSEMVRAHDDLTYQEMGIRALDLDDDISTIAKIFNDSDEPVAPAARQPEREIAPEDFNNDAARQVADSNPDMKVVNDEGNTVSVRELADKADVEFTQAKREASLYKVAVACALGVGE